MRRFRNWRGRAGALALLPLAALMTTASPSTAAEQRFASIEPGKERVTYGEPVTLRGKFPDAPNSAVEIQHRRAAGKRFARITTVQTGSEGRFRARVRPRNTGVWRAQLTNPQRYASAPADGIGTEEREVDTRTGRDRVLVRSVTRARVGKRHVMAGRSVEVSGRVRPGGRRRVVVAGGGREVTTRANRRGRFSVNWRAPSTGRYRIKVRAKRNDAAAASVERAGRVTAYRKAFASWYGPGFYGNRTACGQTLTPDTLGVAHKTMPCGTKLHLRNSGNNVTVRVIDRGPYVGGREFDLTEATKRRLGFGSTGYILTSR